jgi:HK97 family phage major capsid protein
METPEAKARAGEAFPGAEGAAVEAALSGLIGDLKAFQDGVNLKLKAQEERLTMLDRKSLITGRPALSVAAEVEAPHQKAFEAYVRQGDDGALRGLSLEGKALSTAVNADGGYLVSPQLSERIASVLKSTSSLRQIANVVTVDATAYDVIIDRGDAGAGWASETVATTETGTPVIERISIPLHELSAMPKASQRLLDDAAFDVEGWLAGRIAEKFRIAEAAAFVSGDGLGKPKGFLDYAKVANASFVWGSVGYIATGAAGGFGTSADSLIDLVYALEAPYRGNGTFVMNSKTAGLVRKLKDSDGRFFWSDGIAAGQPARLLGYPVLILEAMPDVAANSYSIAFGDFRAAYTVAERPDLRILRDPFSAKPNVLFYATKRVGGNVSDFNAVKLLKFAAS